MAIVACLDLEGVLVPEIWINVAAHTGIEDLRLTTRDISDYDELMAYRIAVMEREGLGLDTIQHVIGQMGPLPGAHEFLKWLQERHQVVILSDTFYEFAQPLMRMLDWPTLFCHSLVVTDGRITGYRLRQKDSKRQAVLALQGLNFQVIASGDSYNDTSMLGQAQAGILMRLPANVVAEFPQYPVAEDFDQLRGLFEQAAVQLAG